MSNSQNLSYNNIRELIIDNADNLSSSNGSLHNLKNNMNNNIINNFSNYIIRKKNSYSICLLNYIFYNEEFLYPILNYLSIKELANFRRINHNILNLIHQYLKERIDYEIQSTIQNQNQNEKLIISYMNHIDEQIPLTTNNWLDLNLERNLQNLNILNLELINKIININDSIKIPDFIYKSLLIIIGFNEQEIIDDEDINWKKFSESILSTSNIMEIVNNIDYENINDIEIMKMLNELNSPELSIDSVKNISEDYSKLILWLQTVVSFHILIHPYIFRNTKGTIQLHSKEYYFAKEMEQKIEKIYKLKRFLLYLKILQFKIGEYVFTIQYSNEHKKKNNNNKYNLLKKKLKKKSFYYNNINNIYDEINNYKIIGNILSYIPIKDNFKYMNISKSFFNGFKYSIDILLFSIIKEIYFFRFQSYDEHIDNVPLIYSHNIFSQFFLMLDNILNEPSVSCSELISKEVVNELKLLKGKNEYIYQISKIFCELTEIKINKKNKDAKKDYVGEIRTLAIKGDLLKIMKNCNKLHFDQKKKSSIQQQLKKFFDYNTLKKVKSINRSVYCLLIWELLFLQYMRTYNIFDFINFEVINIKYDHSQIEFVEYFLKLMENLKYILKLKYHFNKNNKNRKCTLYGFKEAFDSLRKYLANKKLTYKSDSIFSSSYGNFEMIGSAYFNVILNKNNKFSSDILPFYERIFNEIYMFYNDNNFNEEYDNNLMLKNNDKNEKILDALSLEINSFTSLNENENDNKNNMINNIKKSNYNNTTYLKRFLPDLNVNQSFNKKNLFNNKTYYIANRKRKSKYKTKITDIPDNLFIKIIYFFIDLKDLYKFGISNHKFLECFKIHMNVRVIYLNKIKKNIEEENIEIANSINNKRELFYSNYEISHPNKEHATKLLNKLKINDVKELKLYFKKYNKIYVTIITPFILLLKDKFSPKNKNNSIFETAKKILFFSNINSLIKKINSLGIELMPGNIINKVDELLLNNIYFKPEYMKNFNTCFSNVISWVIGVLELHKILRKYSTNIYDSEILEKNEINFCKEIDTATLNYYKALRYTKYFCEEYEKEAKDIMREMDIFID